MQRLVKKLLLAALLILSAPLGFHHAQGERDRTPSDRTEITDTSMRHVGDVVVQINVCSYALTDVSLTETTNSTILKGDLVNRTNAHLDRVTLEVRAYDHAGNLLRGFEEKTIFTARQLDRDAYAPINSGYGVWLQGVPLAAVARVEINETQN